MQFISLGLLMLLTVMLPGPDVAIVTRNSLTYSRRAGVWTSLGIVVACMIHMTYCILGLGVVILSSPFLFNSVKYIGAVYLFYLGAKILLSIRSPHDLTFGGVIERQSDLTPTTAFRQGLLCSLTNPKATLFFLAVFTVVITPQTPHWQTLLFASEMLAIIALWFLSLTFLISHPRCMRVLKRVEKYISALLGILMMGFGVALALFHQ